MPAAVAVPAIVGGASALGGAALSAHAAGSAAKKQVESADRATALSGRIYDEQRNMLQPYVDAGTSSLARLMDGYWNHRPYGAAAPSGGGSVPGVASPSFASAFEPRPVGYGQTPAAAMGPRAIPRGPGGGMVLLRAPTGEMSHVPAAQAEALIARGAQRVG